LVLQEAFDAAERLKEAHEKGTNIEAVGDENADTAETARRDLDRIFNTGGVAALVGNSYGAAKDVGLYVAGEAIRGLADLEAKERERCANFATKAVAAGVAERTVRVAERQGQLMVKMAQAALREVDLSPEQASAFKAALARQAGELTAPS
jgi:predicted hydrolase (HD superfamily)